jgi:predicted Zn-dependent protease
MCRRLHAAPFVTWVAMEESALKIDGERVSFQSSDQMTRERCAKCGSPILFRTQAAPNRVFVARALFPVDDEKLAPTWHGFWDDHASWVKVGDALPKKSPSNPEGAEALKKLATAAADVEADGLFQRGNSAMNARRYADAVSAYDRAEQKGFTRFALYANRGFIHLQEGRYAAALLDIHKALEIEPDNLRQRAIGSYVLALLERNSEATSMINDVLRRDPTDSSALVWAVQALRTLGDDRAVPLLELLKDKPGLSPSDQRNVRTMLADVALENGNAQEAVAGYVAAEREGVSHWSLYQNRARARLELEDTAGAELDIRRALVDRPDLPKLRALLALILIRGDRVDDGKRELDVVMAAPRDPWTDYYCARALDAVGDRAKADEAMDALRRRPGLPRALLRRLLDS